MAQAKEMVDQKVTLKQEKIAGSHGYCKSQVQLWIQLGREILLQRKGSKDFEQ